MDRGRQSSSTESLDSMVERILESAAAESSKRKRQERKMASSERDWWEANQGVGRLDRVQPSNKQPPTANGSSAAAGRHPAASSNKQKHGGKQHGDGRSSVNRRGKPPMIEKTLEDLFEEALESLHDEEESVAVPVRHRRLRSAENWERQIYDSELHDQCRHYRLHAYTSRDTSQVSKPNTHRRRDATVELSCVGGVYAIRR